MTAPTLVAGSAGQSSTAAVSNPVPKLPDPQIGDLLVVSFCANGVPAPPPGFTTKLIGDGANYAAYARVDGTVITAANDGQTFTFGDGGGCVYYTYAIVLVRGAKPTGDPFDGGVQAVANGSGPTTPPLSLTTSVDDELLLLFGHTLFSGFPTATPSAPLVLGTAAANVSHAAAGPQAVAGPSGNQQFGYVPDSVYNFAQLGAVLPGATPPGEGSFSGGYAFTGSGFTGQGGDADFLVDVTATEGGRKRFGGRK